MKHCLTIFLWPCLLLVCCEKPLADRSEASPAPRTPQHGHTRTEPDPDKSAALRKDLKNAVALESSEARETALIEVAWSALEIDSDLALEALRQLPTGNTEKILLIQHYAIRLAEQSPAEAITWAATLELEEEKTAARSQIALVLAETDPYRAASLLSESRIAGHEFDQAAIQILERWADRSAPEAAAWASSFPPGPARKAGISLIVSRWTTTDTDAAFAWIASLQDAGVRNEAFLAMEKAVITQPQSLQDAWLAHADAKTLNELEQKREQAIKEADDNLTDENDENEEDETGPP